MVDHLLRMLETMFIFHHCKIIKMKNIKIINNEEHDYHAKAEWRLYLLGREYSY